jgi:hypothetical protein
MQASGTLTGPFDRETTRANRLWHRLLPMALVLLPGIVSLMYVNRFGVNVPFWDEWSLVPALQAYQDGGNWLHVIWQPSQPHRLFFPKLIFLFLAQLTAWNVVAEMMVSQLLSWLTLVTLWYLYQKTSRGTLWGFVPIAWLVFSLGQWENMLWGWQVAIYLQLFSFLVAIYYLTARRLFLAVVFGLISSYSFYNGLLIWPIGLFLLVGLKVSRAKLLLWLAGGGLTVSLYFANFDFGYSPSPESAGLLFLLVFFLANVGAPLGGVELTLSAVVGVYIVLICLAVVGYRWQARSLYPLSESDFIIASLLLFSLGSSLLMTVGRSGFGHLDWAIGSRYITITSTGIVAVYLLLYNAVKRSSRSIIAPSALLAFLHLMSIGLAAHTINGARIGSFNYESRMRMKYALQNYDNQPDAALENLAPLIYIERHLPYLAAHKLSSFSETMEMLFFTALDAGKPYGEILPGHPLTQRFTCSVSTLKDVGVLFATYGRHNESVILATLKSEDSLLFQERFSAAEVQDNKFRYFILPEALPECEGRELLLQIQSVDGGPGNAITVWTYPAYYSGGLEVPPASELSERVIGLELNGRTFQIFQAMSYD